MESVWVSGSRIRKREPLPGDRRRLLSSGRGLREF